MREVNLDSPRPPVWVNMTAKHYSNGKEGLYDGIVVYGETDARLWHYGKNSGNIGERADGFSRLGDH
ncbi:hypothetical protein YSY43_49790 [Paenibacillus sp. YSY-4.3]